MTLREILASTRRAGASVDDVLAAYEVVSKLGAPIVKAIADRRVEQRAADRAALAAVRTGDTDELLERGRQSVRPLPAPAPLPVPDEDDGA